MVTQLGARSTERVGSAEGRGERRDAGRRSPGAEKLLTARGSPRRVLLCKSCGRKIGAAEVKYRTTENGLSLLICPDCAKERGI